MNLGLIDRRVLITGASRGIGFATARSFLAEGAHVVLVGRDRERLATAARALGDVAAAATVTTYAVDLSDPEGVERMAAEFDEIDVLVNNAGDVPSGSVLDVDAGRWRAGWDLKVHGYIDATREVLPTMYRRGAGVVVNVIGIGGLRHAYGYAAGSSGNAALIAFTHAVGAHSVDHGVRVVGVNPGAVDTDRQRRLAESGGSEDQAAAAWRRSVSEDLPFGRLARPDEVADVITFLASDRASYVSGTTVTVDGGALYR